MKIFKRLNKKGYKHYYEGTVKELDSMDKDNQHLHSEIMQVIMWLYEKYGIWINVEEYKDHASDVNNEPTFISNIEREEYNSPTEAYQGAIEYTLNNLL